MLRAIRCILVVIALAMPSVPCSADERPFPGSWGSYPLPVIRIVVPGMFAENEALRNFLFDKLRDEMFERYSDWCLAYESSIRMTPEKSTAIATIRCTRLKDNQA